MGRCASKPKQITQQLSPNSPNLTHPSTRPENILDFYVLQTTIGYGSFGKVRKGYRKQISGMKVAIKSIDKRKLSSHSISELIRAEISNLLLCDHPNIIRLIESFEDEYFIHIVTELCEGGELLTRIHEIGHYSEQDAARVLQHILRAVIALGTLGICHRDIKPENFLFVSTEKNSELKLIDFGLSKTLREADHCTSRAGTVHYMAPEILEGSEYSFKCDVWSIGVLMYLLLSGTLPYIGNNPKEITDRVQSGEFRIHGGLWDDVSEAAKDLLSKILVKDPAERIEAEQTIQHRWFQSAKIEKNKRIDPKIIQMMKNYKATSRFKNEALTILVKFLSYKEIAELKEAFVKFDIDNSGQLTYGEIENGLRLSGASLSDSDIRNLILELDFNEDGCINYSEFLAATYSNKVELSEELILKTFSYFDVDNSGFISAEDLMKTLQHTGKHFEYSEVLDMIQEVDLEETDGKISYSEFKNMLLDSRIVTK